MNPQDPRVDAIRKLLINFKKYADQEGQLAEAYYTETLKVSVHSLERGVEHICNTEKFLPTVQHLVNACKEYQPKTEFKSVPCFKCNSDGYIFEAKARRPDGSFQTITPEHVPNKDFTYTSMIVGRCDCLNGERFRSRADVAQPLSFIMNKARREQTDCPFEAQELAKSMTYKKLGKTPPKINKQMQSLIEGIINRKEEESYNG